jgi:hypothetical protein
MKMRNCKKKENGGFTDLGEPEVGVAEKRFCPPGKNL